ncbi:MAG TPA: hypothetical protein VLA64_02705 [Azonexus sp.]|nr:hypothetical protein [Azonexus sp.]
MPDNNPALQDDDLLPDPELKGLTPHQMLVQMSLDDATKVTERTAAIAKNRERALILLAAIEKSLGKKD